MIQSVESEQTRASGRSSPWLLVGSVAVVVWAARLVVFASSAWREHLVYVSPRIFLPYLGYLCACVGVVWSGRRFFGATVHGVAYLLAGSLALFTGNATAVGAVVAIMLAAYGAGERLLAGMCGEASARSASEHLAALLLGALVYSYGVAVLMHFPVNYPVVYSVGTVAIIVWCRRGIWLMLQQLGAVLRQPSDPMHLLGAAVVLTYLPYALLPTSGVDAQFKHLYVPKFLSLYHRAEFNPHHIVWFDAAIIPQNLYCAGYLLGGVHAVQLLNIGLFWAGFVGFGRLVAQLFSTRISVIASLVVWTTPLLSWVLASVFIDAASYFSTAVLLAWHFGGNRRRLNRFCVVYGLLVGSAFMCKQQALFVFIPLMALLGAEQMGIFARGAERHELGGWGRRLGQLVLSQVVVLCCAVTVILPILTRNFWLTGNPLYPLYNAVFKSPFFPIENFKADIFEHPFNFELLWSVFFHGVRLVEGPNWSMGLALLLLLPLGFLVCGRYSRGWVWCGLLMLSASLWYVITNPYLRYLVTLLPIAGVVCGFGADAIFQAARQQQRRWIARLLGTSFFTLIVGQAVLMVSFPHLPRPYPVREFLTGDLSFSDNLLYQERIDTFFAIPGQLWGKHARGLAFGGDRLAASTTRLESLAWHFPFNKERFQIEPQSGKEAFDAIFLRGGFQYIIALEVKDRLPQYWAELVPLLTEVVRFQEFVIYVPRISSSVATPDSLEPDPKK